MSASTPDELRPLSLSLWMQILSAAVVVIGVGLGTFWYGSAHSIVIGEPREREAPRRARPAGALVLTEAQLATITVEPVERRLFHDEIVTEGTIVVDEDRATPVFSPYAGRVIALFSKPGDRIAPGQPLFSIQAAEMVQAQNDFLAAVAALNKSRSQLALAQIVERRARTLVEARAAPLKELQAAENDLAGAQNDLRTAEVALEASRNRLRILGKTDQEIATFQQKGVITPETVINAPIEGTVVQRKVGPGQYVNAGSGDPAFIVGDLSRVWLIAHVRETDAPKIVLGQRIHFRVLAYPERFFVGQITYVAASVDPSTRRILVRAEIDNHDGVLKPEMYASVRLTSGREKESPAVPKAAVIYEGEEARVWVLHDDNSVESRRIQGGIVNGSSLQVFAGVSVGERIISKGNLFIDRLPSEGG
jgi:membrane fusion protein, heavy metal efflux system